MKKIIVLFTLCIVLFQVDVMAKTKKRKKKPKTSSTKTTSKTSSSTQLKTLVVSFISMGSGIDFKAVPDFEQTLKEFNASHKDGVKHTMKTWGREGERDYCFQAEIPKNLEDFTTLLKEKYKENKRILIKENATCRQ